MNTDDQKESKLNYDFFGVVNGQNEQIHRKIKGNEQNRPKYANAKNKNNIINLYGPKKGDLPTKSKKRFISLSNIKKHLPKIGIALVGIGLAGAIYTSLPHKDLNPTYDKDYAIAQTIKDYDIPEILSDMQTVLDFNNRSLSTCSEEEAQNYYASVNEVKSNISNLNNDIYTNKNSNNLDFNLIKAAMIDTYLSNHAESISPGDMTISIPNSSEGNIVITVEKLGLSFSIDDKVSLVNKILISQQEYYDPNNITNYSQIKEHINNLEENLDDFKKALPEEAFYIDQNGINLESIDDVVIPETYKSSSNNFTIEDYTDLDRQLNQNKLSNEEYEKD